DLGMETGGTIWLDQSAAGHGWYTESGADSAADFTARGGQLQAVAGGAAADRMDLLTVVEHELGHVLGLADTAGAGLMNQWLTSGTRRELSPSLLAAAGPEAGNQSLQLATTPDTQAAGSPTAIAGLEDNSQTSSGAVLVSLLPDASALTATANNRTPTPAADKPAGSEGAGPTAVTLA